MILNLFIVFNSVQAININSANLVYGGDCGSLLIYRGIVVKTSYIEYIHNGVSFPAYCLDKTKPGITGENSYSVMVENTISDVKLWRIITNGYPYKTIEELGCLNKEEAFTATKQAIYCYIHGNNLNDYKAIGEAGNRTLNALNRILEDAKNSDDIQISNAIKIVKQTNNYQVDDIEKQYVSKIYSIQTQTSITNYEVELQKENGILPDGIKITDLNNVPKQEFSQNEKFKVLIPIKNLREEASFNIQIKTKINSKPVLYGKAPDSTLQDYALTGVIYEDSIGNIKDTYYKNETEVRLIKQDKETKERLEGVQFNVLDENKEIIYSNLNTNSQGEILLQNFIPGKYYIQETNQKDGYLLDEMLIEFEVELNEQLTITVDNVFEKVPDVEKTEKEISKTVIKKLPVTGM